MPYIKYGFMEEIFKSSMYVSDSSLDHIDELSSKRRYRNNMIAMLIIQLYYVLVATFTVHNIENYRPLFMLAFTGFFVSAIMGFVYWKKNKDPDIELFYRYMLFVIFFSIQMMILFFIAISGVDSYFLMRGLMMKFFLSHFCLLVFLKFPKWFSTIVSTINLVVIVYLQFRYNYYRENKFMYLDYVSVLIIFISFLIMNSEMSILEADIIKYADVNHLCMKYIDNLINKMFCLFFTISGGKVVFSNRSARDFFKNLYYTGFTEEENMISNINK